MTKNKQLTTIDESKPKLILDNMDALIRTDSPEMVWEGALCRKKVILAHELHDIILPNNKTARIRNIDTWLLKGFAGVDFIDPDNTKPAEIRGISNIYSTVDIKKTAEIGDMSIYAAVGRNKAKRKIRSAYLRVEFAKKICMMIRTPEAEAVRDYLVKETRAAWEFAKRQSIAQVPALPSNGLSPAIQDLVKAAVETAVKDAVAIAEREAYEKARRTGDYDRMALADLRVNSAEIRNKKDLRADIVRTVKQISIQKGYDYQWLFRRIYNSFALQISACGWREEWRKASNHLDYLEQNQDIRYLRRLRDVVQSFA